MVFGAVGEGDVDCLGVLLLRRKVCLGGSLRWVRVVVGMLLKVNAMSFFFWFSFLFLPWREVAGIFSWRGVSGRGGW
jgi:hypothetical protein